MTFYNNIPQPTQTPDSAIGTLKVFDNYNNSPVTIDSATYDTMVGFFGSRGFGEDSAQSMAYIIIKQALADGYKPLELLDTLKVLSEVKLNNLITDILNYNRYKTSRLGKADEFTTVQEVLRNIVA